MEVVYANIFELASITAATECPDQDLGSTGHAAQMDVVARFYHFNCLAGADKLNILHCCCF